METTWEFWPSAAEFSTILRLRDLPDFQHLVPENCMKTWRSIFYRTERKHRTVLLTVLWTTLVSEVSIPIAPATAADPSAATTSASLLLSPAGKTAKCPRCGEIHWHSAHPLTQVFLLLLNLCRHFCGAGDAERRLCLLYDLSQALAWEDRRGGELKPGSVFQTALWVNKCEHYTLSSLTHSGHSSCCCG